MKPIQIYIGNDTTRDEAEMQEADIKGAWYAAEYHRHIATLETHKVIGPHSWKVGQRLEEGVDFKWQKQGQVLTGEWLADEHLNENDYHAIIQDTRTVIIPIEGEQEETQEELWDEVYDMCERYYQGYAFEELSKQFTITRKK